MAAYGISHTSSSKSKSTEAFLINDANAARDFLEGASETDRRWVVRSADDLFCEHVEVLRNVYAGLGANTKFPKVVKVTVVQEAILNRLNQLGKQGHVPVWGGVPRRALEACECAGVVPAARADAVPVAHAAPAAVREPTLEEYVAARDAQLRELRVVANTLGADGLPDMKRLAGIQKVIAHCQARIDAIQADCAKRAAEEKRRLEAEERQRVEAEERAVALHKVRTLASALAYGAATGDLREIQAIYREIGQHIAVAARVRRDSGSGSRGTVHSAPKGSPGGSVAKSGSKREMILRAMARPEGLSARECMELAGWGPSRNGANGEDATSAARAQMGDLRRSGLYGIRTEKVDGEVRYFWDGTTNGAGPAGHAEHAEEAEEAEEAA